MKPLLAICIVWLVFIPLVSCSKKEVKQVSPDSKRYLEAQTVLEAIRSAYVAKDLRSVQSRTTADGYRSFTSGLKQFDSVDLEFRPVLAEIQGDAVQVNVSWKGKWITAGKITEERGMAVFVLKGQPLQLDNVLRGNPFIYP